jgi:hypothetical protein
MSFDFDTSKRETLQHLIWMASMDGAKAHAWYRANDMARTWPEFYGDMPMLLSNAMQEASNARGK